MRVDALEDITQVFKGINAQAFACSRYARQDCSRPTAIVTAQECPVPPSNSDPSQAALGAIIVNLQVAVTAIAYKCIPV